MDPEAKKHIQQVIKEIEYDTFCHAKGCSRKFDYLNKWGYVGNPTNGTTYCMDHQDLLSKR